MHINQKKKKKGQQSSHNVTLGEFSISIKLALALALGTISYKLLAIRGWVSRRIVACMILPVYRVIRFGISFIGRGGVGGHMSRLVAYMIWEKFLSISFLKVFREVAVATLCGREFHAFVTLLEKKYLISGVRKKTHHLL